MSSAKTFSLISILAVFFASILFVLLSSSNFVATQRLTGRMVPTVDSAEPAALPNLCEVSSGVFSGGQPAGESGYQKLAEMGVKTIISVDGARPDIELARQFGLTYIHLPHGYDGIESEHGAKLAKAVQSAHASADATSSVDGKQGGAVYIHCHHGKHRSPAAAAVACIGLNRITVQEGVDFLKQAGTSPGYQGLYRSVAESNPLDKSTLDRMDASFPEIAPATPLVQSMVQIEKHADALAKLIQRDGEPMVDQPDLDVSHEALLLFEQFAELERESTSTEEGYKRFVSRSRENAKALHQLLAKADGNFPREEASKWLGLVRQDCKRCHRQYRD